MHKSAGKGRAKQAAAEIYRRRTATKLLTRCKTGSQIREREREREKNRENYEKLSRTRWNNEANSCGPMETAFEYGRKFLRYSDN